MKPLFRRLVRPLLERQVRRLIARKHLRVVAVAGAVGKTSTKLAIATVLQQKYRVLVHPGNFNADISLPLAIFEQPVPQPIINPIGWLHALWTMERRIRGSYPYDVVVLELGTDHPGEIPHFVSYLSPEVGVVTAVTPEHMEFFHTLDAVAAEELSLVAGSRTAVINRDDVDAPYWERYVAPHAHALSYGLNQSYDYSLAVHHTDPVAGTEAACYRAGRTTIKHLQMARYGLPAAKSAAAAYAVADAMGLTINEITAGLAALEPVSGRMQPLAGINASTLIDDTYNSSPEAAFSALSALAAVKSKGRRIAIMGSMNELGETSPDYHAQVGRACAGLDLLLTVGQDANDYLGPAAVQAGLDAERWHSFVSPYAAGRWLAAQIKTSDIILAKGSQNRVFTEEALKMVLADPRDAAKLVRQSPAWQRQKAAQFPDAADQ